MIRKFSVAAAAILFALPLFVSAQVAQPAEAPAFLKDIKSPADFGKLTPEQQQEAREYLTRPSTAPEAPKAPAGTVDCFQYYRFGSVQVDVSPSVSSTVPGVPVTFSGKIKNANPYPVIGGSVYAKIFRKQTDDSLAHQNGHFLVDQFVVKDGVTLRAEGEEPIVFDWTLPRTVPSGEYEIAMFFYTADRFNLLGLTFTDDVVGNKASFSVKSDMRGEVALDKNAVALNGQPYRFAAFPPRFGKDDAVKAEVVLTNTTAKSQSVSLSWTLYNWDALRESNRIDQKKETLTLKPGESKSLAYETREHRGAVSFLVVEAEANGQKSILDIRFVRTGVSETRINFPGILKFPIVKGERNTVFSCAHSTNLPLVENSEIELTLKDGSGKTIHTYAYQGGITGAMMGVRDDFVPKETADTFVLTTTLRKDGKVVESLDLRYDCEKIDPSLCSKERGSMTGKGTDILGDSGKGIALLILLVLAALLGLLAWKLWTNRKGSKFFPVLFGVLLAGGMLWGGGAEAKNISWTGLTPSDGLAVKGPCYPLYGFLGSNQDGLDAYIGSSFASWACAPGSHAWGFWTGIGMDLGQSNVTVEYHAEVANAVTGEIYDDTSTIPNIPVGTELQFRALPHQAEHINWFGVGGSMDSPFGYWVANAGQPAAQCVASDLVYTDNSENYAYAYIQASVNPPGVTFTHTGSTATLTCNPSGDRCRVDSPGVVTGQVVFSSTYGKFYSQHGGGDKMVPQPSECVVPSGNALRINRTDTAGLPNRVWLWGPEFINGRSIETTDYVMNVPAKTITFNLNAVPSGNTAPAIPIIVPSALNNGYTDSSQSFAFTSTDSENDTLRYGVDWDNDGIADQWLPGAGHVASGTPETGTYSWPTPGVYTFRVLAQDIGGLSSAWAPHTVTITSPPSPPNVLTLCQDSCGSGIRRDGATIGMGIGETRIYSACYSPTADCTNPGGTASATWTDGGNPTVSLSGSNPAPSIVIQGDASGTETVTATVSGTPATGTIVIPVTCVSSCTAARRADVCAGESFPETNSCGTPETCTGTRYCDFNWKEVAPGS